MPRPAKPPRLWPSPARPDRAASWVILDRGRQRSTGCSLDDIAGAEQALARYIAEQHTEDAASGVREPQNILIDDVLTRYVLDVVPKHARPQETASRIRKLSRFWTGLTLDAVTGVTCREYAQQSSTLTAARRELEDLRAAIAHHRSEGLHDRIISVTLPERPGSRERWLSREEAARMVWAAWRYREQQNRRATDRRTRQHVARFILVALYTGSRAGVICSAAFEPEPGRAWVDLRRGVLYRRPAGERETKKRRPPVRLPVALLAHLRRWRARGQRYVVEWNGVPVERVGKAFRSVVRSTGTPGSVTPHTLRHTAATWLMQAGAPIWEISGYLGMTVETLERVYGHHHPDFQAGVHAAFRRRRA